MKFIITEIQHELINLEKRADVLYNLMNKIYPDNYSEYNESSDTSYIYNDSSKEELLFFYEWKYKDFLIGESFVNTLYKKTGFSYLNIDELDYKYEKEMFNKIIKVFAKRHYGWNVNNVWFHNY